MKAAHNILYCAYQSGRFRKLNKKVTFPTKLDLTPYMSTTDGTDQYNLYAVVVHLDMLNASFFGHYICYIKNRRGHWLKIDDCKVHVCFCIMTMQIFVSQCQSINFLLLFVGYVCR